MMGKLTFQRDRQLASGSAVPGYAQSKPAFVTGQMLSFLRETFTQQGWDVEHLNAVFFDAAMLYIDHRRIGSGQLDKLSTRLRPLFDVALDLGASGLILAHNHPSGDCRPSPSDILATRHLARVASALDIHLFDHLIITPDRAYSMRGGAEL